MQEMLNGFQADLGGISDEIKHLQQESTSMNIRLRNRKSAEQRIQSFLTHIIIPPGMADTICNSDVDSKYMDDVVTLEAKHKYISSRDAADDGSSTDISPGDTVAGREVKSHIEKLRLKAVAKVRDYFLFKIGELRKSRTNVRVIQVNSLIKYSKLNYFLGEAAPDIHDEIRDVYIETMGKTILNLFKTYQIQLSKLDSKVACKNDLIAVEEGAVKDMFSQRVNMGKRSDPFVLGERVRVLEMAEQEEKPIMVHVASAEKEKYPYEMLFRSVMKHLMDSATNEYVFTRDFFAHNSRNTAREAFNAIFTKTLSIVLENVENFLFNCHDAIALLLMIRLTHTHRIIMKQRRVNVLDNFFDRVNMLLWPRLKGLIDNNIRALRASTPKKLGSIDLHAHYISRRYAEFAASILTLSKGLDGSSSTSNPTQSPLKSSGEDMLKSDMSLLHLEVTKLLHNLASTHSTTKTKTIFLINNFDQIIVLFNERKVTNEEMTRFEDKLMQHREQFVEEELAGSYAKMITFVKQTEAQLAAVKESGGELNIDVAIVEGLVRQFNSSWKSGIESINKNVLSYFSNLRNGTEILKQCLTQLLLYYTRLQEIIKQGWKKPPSFAKEIVSTSTILAEIKKYALAF